MGSARLGLGLEFVSVLKLWYRFFRRLSPEIDYCPFNFAS